MTWHLRLHRRLRAERDQRQLLLIAAGQAGGKAYEQVHRLLAREIGRLADQGNGERETEAPQCATPRSQEEFEAMMKDEN